MTSEAEVFGRDLFKGDLRLIGRSLGCERGGRLVYRNLDIDVEGGRALIVRGPNGAGKSSLLRQIAGLVSIMEGSLILNGGKPDCTLADQIHYLGHQDALKPVMSVGESLSFWAAFLGGTKSLTSTVDAALEVFSLEALRHLPVAYLSAGQKRRVALSRLLLADRPLWLLDEPSIGLDQDNLARLSQFMEEHLAQGGIIVTATHQELGLSNADILDLGAHAESVPA